MRRIEACRDGVGGQEVGDVLGGRVGKVVVDIGFEVGLGGDVEWDEERAFVGVALLSDVRQV